MLSCRYVPRHLFIILIVLIVLLINLLYASICSKYTFADRVNIICTSIALFLLFCSCVPLIRYYQRCPSDVHDRTDPSDAFDHSDLYHEGYPIDPFRVRNRNW